MAFEMSLLEILTLAKLDKERAEEAAGKLVVALNKAHTSEYLRSGYLFFGLYEPEPLTGELKFVFDPGGSLNDACRTAKVQHVFGNNGSITAVIGADGKNAAYIFLEAEGVSAAYAGGIPKGIFVSSDRPILFCRADLPMFAARRGEGFHSTGKLILPKALAQSMRYPF